jgi:hypothetical protein
MVVNHHSNVELRNGVDDSRRRSSQEAIMRSLWQEHVSCFLPDKLLAGAGPLLVKSEVVVCPLWVIRYIRIPR